jgi:hypothetical protein
VQGVPAFAGTYFLLFSSMAKANETSPATSSVCEKCGSMTNKQQTSIRKCNDCGAETTDFVCRNCEIVQFALNAFWAVVAAAHPEITSGDFDETDMKEQCRQHIEEWISNNSVSCDECGRDCTSEQVPYELRQTSNGKMVLCRDCLPTEQES